MGTSSIRSAKELTRAEISLIKGMGLRKDRQVDIAYWFSLPQTTVNHILNRERYASIEPAPMELLPEKGPYKIVSEATFTKLTDAAAVPATLISLLLTRIEGVQSSIDELCKRTQMEGKRTWRTATTTSSCEITNCSPWSKSRRSSHWTGRRRRK